MFLFALSNMVVQHEVWISAKLLIPDNQNKPFCLPHQRSSFVANHFVEAATEHNTQHLRFHGRSVCVSTWRCILCAKQICDLALQGVQCVTKCHRHWISSITSLAVLAITKGWSTQEFIFKFCTPRWWISFSQKMQMNEKLDESVDAPHASLAQPPPLHFPQQADGATHTSVAISSCKTPAPCRKRCRKELHLPPWLGCLRFFKWICQHSFRTIWGYNEKWKVLRIKTPGCSQLVLQSCQGQNQTTLVPPSSWGCRSGFRATHDSWSLRTAKVCHSYPLRIQACRLETRMVAQEAY